LQTINGRGAADFTPRRAATTACFEEEHAPPRGGLPEDIFPRFVKRTQITHDKLFRQVYNSNIETAE